MAFCPKFSETYKVEAPCKKSLEVIYTNDERVMAYHIRQWEDLLKWEEEEDAIVGIDVEYTSPRDGDKQRAALV